MMSMRMTRLSAGFALFLAFWAGCTGSAEVAEAQPVAKAGALLSLTVGGTPDKVVVELTATRPIASSLRTIGTPPTRLFVDLLQIVPEVPDTTAVNLGAVKRVRVALNRSRPPVTRVVLDVEGASRYRVEPGATEHELRITVETDTPAVLVETDTYSAWFSRTSHTLARLLAQTITGSGSSQGGGIDLIDQGVALEWDVLTLQLSVVTPPLDLAAAHELLVTAGAVGHAAFAEPRDRFAAADVRAAAAGAAILVQQAERLAAPHLTDEPIAP